MPSSSMSYVYSNIFQEIPQPILELAFKPRRFATTIEERISAEVMPSVLLDVNLIGGKRRELFMRAEWLMNLAYDDDAQSSIGTGVQGSYYLVPPEAREGMNIASVLGVSPSLSGSFPDSGIGFNGSGSYGNTVSGMMSEMLNTRTFAQYAVSPQISLEGTNIIRFYPEQMVSDGVMIAVMLEFDSEFLNLNVSAILSLRELCLCAVKRYIATALIIPIDESEVVAGMEIGIVKEIVRDYKEDGKQYKELLIKTKGSMQFDSRTLYRLASFAL